MSDELARYKPGLPRRWLRLLAGLIWCGVGLLLLRWSWVWASAEGWFESGPFLLGGLFVAMGTGYFFRRMASRNIERIQSLPEDPCLFAFQSWTSYPLVIFMMGLGIALRKSPLPRTWLMSVYLAIGGGLFLAGPTYFASLLQSDLRLPS